MSLFIIYLNVNYIHTHTHFLFFQKTLIQCFSRMRTETGLNEVRAKFSTPGNQRKGSGPHLRLD